MESFRTFFEKHSRNFGSNRFSHTILLHFPRCNIVRVSRLLLHCDDDGAATADGAALAQAVPQKPATPVPAIVIGKT